MQPDSVDRPDTVPPVTGKGDPAQDTRRVVRVPYRSFGVQKSLAVQSSGSRSGHSSGAASSGDEAFSAWAKERNRRLVRLAAGRPMQPPALPPLSEFATSYVNNRSSTNELLNKMRRAVSDAPGTASSGISLPVARRGTRVPVVYAADLPVARGSGQHPWVRSPSLPTLGRRSYPSLVVLMILIWGAVLGAGIYKALKPPSGFILTNDRW